MAQRPFRGMSTGNLRSVIKKTKDGSADVKTILRHAQPDSKFVSAACKKPHNLDVNNTNECNSLRCSCPCHNSKIFRK